MTKCNYNGCGKEVNSRPYSAKRDYPSVTTVVSLLDDGKSATFPWSAAGIAAVKAVHFPEDWNGLETEPCTHDKTGFCPACRYLRSEFDRQWKTKATFGNHCHHLISELVSGEPVEQDDDTKGVLDGWEKFVTDHAVEFELVERTIFYGTTDKHHGYRGSFDAICRILNLETFKIERWLIDWKTGQYHPLAQALQLSGYRYCSNLTTWENGEEILGDKMPLVDKCGVVLLSKDGTYQLQELPANGDMFGAFLRLRDLWNTKQKMDKWAKENPLVMA